MGWYIGQSVVDQPEWDLIAPRIKHSWRICRRRSPLNGQLVVGQSGAVVGADQPHGWLLQRDNYSRFGIILRAYKVDLLMSGHNHCSAHARGRLRTHTGFIAYKTESDTVSDTHHVVTRWPRGGPRRSTLQRLIVNLYGL